MQNYRFLNKCTVIKQRMTAAEKHSIPVRCAIRSQKTKYTVLICTGLCHLSVKLGQYKHFIRRLLHRSVQYFFNGKRLLHNPGQYNFIEHHLLHKRSRKSRLAAGCPEMYMERRAKHAEISHFINFSRKVTKKSQHPLLITVAVGLTAPVMAYVVVSGRKKHNMQ